jgi:hypothetical protein
VPVILKVWLEDQFESIMTQNGLWCHFPFREKVAINMQHMSTLEKSLVSSAAESSESEEEQEIPSPLKRRNKSFIAKDHEDPHAEPVSSEDMEEDEEESRLYGWAKKKKKKKSQFIAECYSTDDEMERAPKMKIKRLTSNRPRKSESDDTRSSFKVRKHRPDTSEPEEKQSKPKKRRSTESDDDEHERSRKSKSDKKKERSRQRSSSNDEQKRRSSSQDSSGKKKRKKLKKTPKVRNKYYY